MQNRSFQAFPRTLFSNKLQYRVHFNDITGMWELRSSAGKRLNTARDIWILAEHLKTKDTLIIPKGTEGVEFLSDSMFKDIEEYSLMLRTYMLVGTTDFSHIDIPEATCHTHKLSREQLISLGFKQRTSYPHQLWILPDWWLVQCDQIHSRFHEYLYAEEHFT